MERARVLVVGLDGATFTLMRPLLAAGRLPTLARLTQEGASGPLRTIIPPHTAAAWTSMMTGINPGGHGVTGFEQIALRDYGCRGELATSRLLAGRTWFDLLGERGLRVAAIRVPMTYPAWPVNGVMVSGYPSPSRGGHHTWPRALAESIPPPDELPASNSPDERLDVLLREVDITAQITLNTLQADAYDLCMVVFQQTDQAHHFFWQYIEPSSPAYSAADAAAYGGHIAQVYERIDAALARILDAAAPRLALVVSDHGGAPSPRHEVHLNAWLAEQGLLAARDANRSLAQRLYDYRHVVLSRARRLGLRKQLERLLPRRARGYMEQFILNVTQVDWARTQVYRFPLPELTEGLAINLRGRQPRGIVAVGAEYHALRERLMRALPALRTPDGEQLITGLWRREELFSGPHAGDWPDIILRLHPDFQAGKEASVPLFTPVPLQAFERHSGTHDLDGILLAHGAGVRAGAALEGAGLLDIAPTVFHALGVPVPDHFEGAIPCGLLADAPGGADAPARRNGAAKHAPAAPVPVAAWAEGATPAAVPAIGAAGELSPEDENSIRERLRALGYL
ncbi:MAG TPA: alkaline phosphatase family protein [Ktedonobacterales bacterium]